MIFDPLYIIIVLPAVLIAFAAELGVNAAHRRYSRVATRYGMTGAESAQMVLSRAGVHGVRVEHTTGNLTDHFDPRTNTIYLSDTVYAQTSVAAVGIAAHEAGHAVQYAESYAPMKARAAIIPVCNFGSSIAMPLVLVGLLFASPAIAYAGVIAFSLATLFQLITLPVEFNASRRAMTALESSRCFSGEELASSKKMLRAAAMTYVAALATSLANLLYLATLAGRSRRR